MKTTLTFWPSIRPTDTVTAASGAKGAIWVEAKNGFDGLNVTEVIIHLDSGHARLLADALYEAIEATKGIAAGES